MEARRTKGLCYNCDEAYSQGHRCKKLFLLERIEEVMEEIQKETDEENMDVSIHVISVTRGAQTVQVKGYIRDLPLNVLIDSGSTKCFIHHTLAQSLHLFIRETPTIRVTVVNGK